MILADPSEATGYFFDELKRALLSDSSGIVDEKDGLLARYVSACEVYSQRPADTYDWRGEAEFWRLLRHVLPSEVEETGGGMETGGASDHGRVKEYMSADPMFVHVLRVREWLEGGAGAFIPAEIRYAPVMETVSRVESVHPDGTGVRDDLDLMYEDAQLDTLWAWIRRGRLQDAIARCFQSGQPWRAAILSGGLLHLDPLLDGVGGDVSGNPERSLWQASVREMLPALPVKERAVYGCLVGDLQAMLPMCASWQDFLWAHTVAITESCIQALLSGHPHSPSHLHALLVAAVQAVQELFGLALDTAQDTLHDTLFPLQRSLILRGDFAAEAAELATSRASEQYWRLASTALIILREFSCLPTDPLHSDSLLSRHLCDLAERGNIDGAVFLCGHILDAEMQAGCLATILEGIDGGSSLEEKTVVSMAKSAGVDVEACLQQIGLSEVAGGRVAAGIRHLLLAEGLKDSLLIEAVAFACRHALASGDLDGAFGVLSAIAPKLPSYYPLVHQADARLPEASLVKEILYYEQLRRLYARPLPEEYCRGVVEFLQSDWLADVEPIGCSSSLLPLEDREEQLSLVRSQQITQHILVAIKQTVAGKGDDLLRTLADPDLELSLELQREGRLQEAIELLLERRLGSDDTSLQQTVSFLSQARLSLSVS